MENNQCRITENQLLTKSPIELKDNFIMLLLPELQDKDERLFEFKSTCLSIYLHKYFMHQN